MQRTMVECVVDTSLPHGLNPESARLTLPADVFVDAVRLASVPRSPVQEPQQEEGLRCAVVQRHYAAVDRLTAWWNATAPPELRGAFSFLLYVKVPTDDGTVWASGDREEGYVSAEAMQAGSRRGEAWVLDRILLLFVREATATLPWWFEAPNVDGSHGVSGGLPAWLSGDELIATDAYDALHEFPARFPALWAQLQTR